jgi:TatD DNase family protein
MHVAEKIANLKEISVEEVANATTETAYNLFAKLKN